MSMEKPFRVEVAVDAPRDEVWRALTEPERIRQWFGWEYEGLDEEIQFIFVTHARPMPPDRIELGPDGVIELEDLGGRTVIRAIKPGDLDAIEWRDVYGDIEEGWTLFFNQLRHRFARSGGRRRMIVRRADALAPAVATPEGSLWHETRYQRAVESNGELVAIMAKAPLSSREPAEVMLLVTTYDLDDEAFAAAETRWTSWWDSLPRS